MYAPEPAEIAERLGLRRSGGRYVGPCPKCGGRAESTRFLLDERGGYKCFSCGIGGDRVRWLREMEGMGCKAAHVAAGVECAPSCPRYADCSKSPSERRTAPRRKALEPRCPRQAERPGPAVREQAPPPPAWAGWAEQHVEDCADMLTRADLDWLARRGIPAAAARRFRLGRFPADRRVPWQAMGLSAEGRDKPRCWIPAGLVIPSRYLGGAVCRVRHRRDDAARARFAADLKYAWIQGSASLPATMGLAADMTRPAVIVVVEAELDGMAVAAAVPEAGVVALGTVAQALTPELEALCGRARNILVALDADEPNSQGRRPGAEAARAWQERFSQAQYWPVPKPGKDVGEYAALGGDIRAWVLAALPSGFLGEEGQHEAVADDCDSPDLVVGRQGPEDADPCRGLVALLEREDGWIEEGPTLRRFEFRHPGGDTQVRNKIALLACGDERISRTLESLARIYKATDDRPHRCTVAELKSVFGVS